MKPQFVITANVTVVSKDGSFNQSEEFKEIKVFPFEQHFKAKKRNGWLSKLFCY